MPKGVKNAMNNTLYFLIPYFIFLFLTYFKIPRKLILFFSLLGIIGIGLFPGLFYGMFYNNLKREYLEASNCIVKGIYPEVKLPREKADDPELYKEISIIMDIEENNQKQTVIGKTCQSSYKQSALSSTPRPYSTYDIGEVMDEICISYEYVPSTDDNGSSQECIQWSVFKYRYSQQKIPAWQCIPHDEPIKEVYPKCYYTKIGSDQLIKDNQSIYTLEQKGFYQVIFDEHPYYNKMALQLIFGFCFFPALFLNLLGTIPITYLIRQKLKVKK